MKHVGIIGAWLMGSFLLAVPARAQDESGSPPEALPEDPVTPEAEARARRLLAIRRDPKTLPKSEPGRWAEWTPERGVPDEWRDLFLQAARATQDGRHADTLADLFEILDGLPDHPLALYQGGVTYFRLRRYGDATVLLERMIDIVPAEVARTRVLGHCYYTLGDYEGARDHYEKILALSPEETEAHRGLGLSLMRLGESEEALASLREALRLSPDHAEAQRWVAEVLYERGELDEARAAALRARELDPYEPAVWFLLSQVFYELELEEQAEEAQARFKELDVAAQEIRGLEGNLLHQPGALHLYARLAEVHAEVGDRAAVRSVTARMLRVAPGDVEVRLFVLDTLVGAGDMEAAKVAATAMGEAMPDDPRVWKRLEEFYRRIRDRMKQMEAGERVRRLQGTGN